MDKASNLFSPLVIGDLELRNRLVMAPLTRSRTQQPGNIPTEMNALYYGQRAGAGLIISEATQISPQGMGYAMTPGIHDPAQVEGWKKVTTAVHEKGGKIFLQLWHVGRISHPSLQPEGALPVAPSAVRPDGEAFTYEGFQPFVTPRALETSELPGIVGQYREAAINAKEAGFDGVEIHGANGYLLDQFLQDGTNLRSDQYGGSLENRMRFPLEVVEAVLEVWDASRVGYRISPLGTFNSMSDSNPRETFTAFSSELSRYHLAYLHVVEAFGDAPDPKVAFDLTEIAKAFKGVYMANGGYNRDSAAEAISEGRAQLVSFGVSYLANPDLDQRFRLDAPLNKPDTDTFYGGDEKGYTDYPFLKDVPQAAPVS